MRKTMFFVPVALLMAVTAFSQDAEDFEYTQNRQGGVTIIGYNGRAKNVVVPENIGGQRVIAIGGRAFRGRGLTSVTLPQSVESVGVMAFADNDIEDLELPEGVRIIETGAFSSNRIESLSIPDSVRTIRYNAFGRNPVRNVNISRNVRAINPRVFTQNQLKRISIGGGVEIYLGNFDDGFVNYYQSRAREEGNYERRGNIWVITAP